MTAVRDLLALTGDWEGESSLWFEPGPPVSTGPSHATISSAADRKIAVVDYQWVYEGETHEGRMLIGGSAGEGIQIAWCDSFHMDTNLMLLHGDDAGVLRATGSYGVPDSEPWGWRIELEPGAAEFGLRMYNPLPASMGGGEAKAVEATYRRA